MEPPTPPAIRAELDAELSISDEQVQFFRKNGFIRLKDVFSPELLGAAAHTRTRRVCFRLGDISFMPSVDNVLN
jgi:hypothetical protein